MTRPALRSSPGASCRRVPGPCFRSAPSSQPAERGRVGAVRTQPTGKTAASSVSRIQLRRTAERCRSGQGMRRFDAIARAGEKTDDERRSRVILLQQKGQGILQANERLAGGGRRRARDRRLGSSSPGRPAGATSRDGARLNYIALRKRNPVSADRSGTGRRRCVLASLPLGNPPRAGEPAPTSRRSGVQARSILLPGRLPTAGSGGELADGQTCDATAQEARRDAPLVEAFFSASFVPRLYQQGSPPLSPLP
jgi:hypothetical protein